MEKYKLDGLYNLCPLLKIDCIGEEIENYLFGFKLDNSAKTDLFELAFKDKFKNRIEMSFKSSCLVLFNYLKNFLYDSFKYNGEVKLDRQILINAVKCQNILSVELDDIDSKVSESKDIIKTNIRTYKKIRILHNKEILIIIS